MLRYIKYYLLLLILIIIQRTFIWMISLTDLNIVPDIVLIGVVILAIKRGRIEGMIGGFFAGLILDSVSGNFIGLYSLAYVLAGFFAGYFQESQDKVISKKAFLGVMIIASLISNFIYFEIYFLSGSSLISFIEVIYKYILPTTLYTLIFSTIFIIIPRKKQSKFSY
ncbi:MAG: rod shape-determining protein MreD [Ignavibacteria bacterium]|nr:rod shape-determining protein MreD [Ignavibacteria bacterium]